jgi:hypothetical protein
MRKKTEMYRRLWMCEVARIFTFCYILQLPVGKGFVCSGTLAAMEQLLERARRSQGCKQVGTPRFSPENAWEVPIMTRL